MTYMHLISNIRKAFMSTKLHLDSPVLYSFNDQEYVKTDKEIPYTC